MNINEIIKPDNILDYENFNIGDLLENKKIKNNNSSHEKQII